MSLKIIIGILFLVAASGFLLGLFIAMTDPETSRNRKDWEDGE